MHNPQSNSYELAPRTIYQYDHHTNTPWNILEYKVPALHNDYKQIIRNRAYASQKKGVKTNDFYITKRGFYMDYDLKVAKSIPSSVQHIDQNPWNPKQITLQGDALKEARQTKKYTYLQRITRRLEMHPIPGVAAYSLEKPLGQNSNSSIKINPGQTRYFYENTTFLSDQVPGPGYYNPHDQVNKLRNSKVDWKTEKAKHAKWNSILLSRQKIKPAPGTYSPLSQQYRSFSVLQKLSPREKQIKNGFGSDSRFVYTRPNKKLILEQRPSPTAYQTKIDWKGKSVSPKKMEWIKMIWKGSQSQVYH